VSENVIVKVDFVLPTVHSLEAEAVTRVTEFRATRGVSVRLQCCKRKFLVHFTQLIIIAFFTRATLCIARLCCHEMSLRLSVTRRYCVLNG